MIKIKYKKNGIEQVHIWFPTGKISREGDIVFCHNMQYEPLQESGEFNADDGYEKTAIKDLTVSEEELFASIGKHARTDIKRSYRDDFSIIFYNSKEFLAQKDKIISEIGDLYSRMYSAKDNNSHASINAGLIESLAAVNSMYIGVCYWNNKPVGFDAVLHDDKIARLLFSAFIFRDDGDNSQLLSRGHLRLDWELLISLKRLGVECFDFGGISDDSAMQGISSFKRKFHGIDYICQGKTIPVSLKGKIYIYLSKLINH